MADKFKDLIGAGRNVVQTAGSRAKQAGIGVRETVQSTVATARSQVDIALDRASGVTNQFADALQSPAPPRSTKIDEALRQWKPGQIDLTPENQRDQAPNVSKNQSQASASSQPGQQIFRPDVNAGLLFGNPLNDYIDVQQHIILTVVPEGALSGIQPDIISQGAGCAKFFDDMQQAVRKDGSVTLASTGEVFRNESAEVSFAAFEAIKVGPQLIDNTKAALDDLRKQRRAAEEAGNSTNASLLDAEILRNERVLAQMRSARREEIIDNATSAQIDVSDRRYYNITNLSLTNMMSPTKQNPMFSNLLAMKMTLVEPHGFRLHDDIRMLGKRLGYEGIHYHRMVYRIDIFFSGWIPDTGEYVPLIPITIKATEQEGCSNAIISYYMNITDMQASTTHTGTEYTIDFVPLGGMALRPEEALMEATTITLGKDPTFGDFLKKLSTELAKAKKSQSKADTAPDGTGVERIYEFIAPKDLLEARYNDRKAQSASTETGATENPEDGYNPKFRQGSTVINAIRRALEDLPAAQDRFLVDGPENEDFNSPRIRYTVRMNTVYEQKNPNINDYKRIRFQYIIEPHYTYKDFEVSSYEQSLKALSLQARLRRLKEMIRLGMVQRKYSYLFTPENTEVIDLDLKFSMFYFKTLSQDDTNSRVYTMATTNAAQEEAKNQDNIIEGSGNAQATESEVLRNIQEADLRRRLETNVEQSLKRLFGIVPTSVIAENAAGLDVPNLALIPSSKEVRGEGANLSDSVDQRKNLYLRSVQNNLEQDLLEIDLKVRGDPIYLFSPYANQSLNILDPLDSIRYNNLDTEGNQDVDKLVVQPSTDKVFFLAVNAPEQNDFMNPDRQEASTRDSIIGGFYMIVEVQSEFNGGQFTQTIKAMKIPNLNYLAENISLFESKPVTGAEEVDANGATPSSQINDRPEDGV